MSIPSLPKRFTSPVLSFSQKGLGIIQDENGKKYFVPMMTVGDVALFEEIPPYQEIPKNYGMAKMIELITPSADRKTPHCQHWGKCNGCPWMIIDYEKQLKYKTDKILYSLKRLKITVDENVLKNIIPSSTIFNYRNRGQFKTDGIKLGYVSSENKEIIDITSCPVLTDLNQKNLDSWRASLPNKNWVPGPGHFWNYIDFDESSAHENPIINKRRPFAQGNEAQNDQMKKWLRKKLEEHNEENIVSEFFCGSGNLTEVIASFHFKKIMAIEVQGSALEILKTRGLKNCQVIAADLFESNIWKKLEQLLQETNIWILDPPREGLTYQKAWFKIMPKLHTIIYISCEIDSFARDCREFYKQGYKLSELTPLDLFPHTPHVEILSVFNRAERNRLQ